MSLREITSTLKTEARQLGFSAVGACPAVTPSGITHLIRWLDSGYAGRMDYMGRRIEAYRDVSQVMPGVKSLLVLGLPYRTADPNAPMPGQGRVSRYAWSPTDYHDVIRDRLRQLARTARRLVPGIQLRGVVDTAPLLEREFAVLAGLGWIGTNTMLINRSVGSWLFLAALLLDCPLEYDAPHQTSHCGRCTACLDACPTGALVEPHVLDARRCISYLTIELGDQIPRQLRPDIGQWLFGCDVCQDVCPWNRKPPRTQDDAFEPREDLNPVALPELFYLDEDAFRRRFRQTPLWRCRRRGLLRNAAVVLGNRPTPHALDALRHGLNDSEPLVRDACAWALGWAVENL